MYPKNAHIHTHIHILGHSWLGKDKYTVPLKRSASIPLKKNKFPSVIHPLKLLVPYLISCRR